MGGPAAAGSGWLSRGKRRGENRVVVTTSTWVTMSRLVKMSFIFAARHLFISQKTHSAVKSSVAVKMGILAVLSFTQGLATFSQVLLGLPAALSLLGPSSFLLLSLLFTLHHLLYSTLRLCLKNTPLAPLVSIVAVLSPAISAALALLTLYFYLAPPAPGPSLAHCLVNILPFAYAQILRWVSPLFTLLEGISTLLVIQVAGRVGKGWADEEDKDDGLEWRSVVALVAAALVYCAGLAGIIKVCPVILHKHRHVPSIQRCRHSRACHSLPSSSAPPSPPSSFSPSSASPSSAQTSSKQVLSLSTSSTLPGFPAWKPECHRAAQGAAAHSAVHPGSRPRRPSANPTHSHQSSTAPSTRYSPTPYTPPFPPSSTSPKHSRPTLSYP